MKRKLLFLTFSDDACTQNHLFKYALDLHDAGHELKIILEGRATACLRRLGDSDPSFTALFDEAMTKKLIHGSCEKATGGCGHPKAKDDGIRLARERAVPLLSDLDGHAGIRSFVDEGYEIVIF